MLSRVLVCLLLCCQLGCGTNAPAPVEDRTVRNSRAPPPSHETPSSQYRVQSGDTLYSIAFRYGLDYRGVAAANSIPAPYTIHPGQRLSLREVNAPPVVVKTGAKPRAAATTPKSQAKSASAAGITTAGASIVTTVPAPAPKPNLAAPSAEPKSGSGKYVGAKVGVWRWPTTGRVIRGYSHSVHKGIDITGNKGDPVNAVAAGKVVYAGTGIVGLGELLIVKHNEVYLSAYAHNDRLLVAEGQSVSAGQQIAEKGSTGTDTVKLHFEIRKEGKPIDPQRLLPRR